VSRRLGLGLVFAAISLSASLNGASRSALASASLASASATAAAALPQVERALILFDAKSGREELVWSLEPRDPGQPSLQIVPVPSKPEVSTLGADALDALIESYPLFRSSGSVVPSLGTKKAVGAPSTPPSSAASLTWKTFGPTELDALRAHLDEQKHPADVATSGWLERLSLRGFHFVAVLRPARIADPKPGDAPAASAAAATPSTPTRAGHPALLRMRFATPAPYLPYSEPSPPSSAGLARGRSLNVWSITAEARSPIAVYREGEHRHWVRPLRETTNESVERAQLLGALGAALSPSLPRDGERWAVQRFADQKSNREGFGDVLFVPRTPTDAASGDEQLAKAVALFDAELEVAR
jgi:hypothetical protein